MKIKNLSIGVIQVIVGLLLLFGPFALFNVCSTEPKIMKCYWCSRTICVMGILIILLGLMMCFVHKRETIMMLILVALVISLITICIPKFVIGGCSSSDMRCNMITFPCIYAINIINMIVLVIFETNLIKGKEE